VTLGPTNLNMIEELPLVALGRADLAGARAVIRSALPHVDPPALLAFFVRY
jgi:hypothetical protein